MASPRAPRLVIARPRLLARLDSDAPLTLLHAPTGFGKTTLVRQWLAGRGTAADAVAGVRVRPNGGDPAAFWIAMIDALTDVGLSPPPLAAQRSPQGMAERMLDTLDRPLTVWVDNFENAAGNRIGEVLVDLAGHVQELRLIIAQRDDEHVADRWSADLEVTTIGPDDLLLTPDEAAALLTLAGASITPDAVDLVQGELGGWPAPTRSLALALALADGGPADLAALAAPTAAAFLRRLLPASTPGERVDFVQITAVPDEFSARMGARLTDDPSAKAHLEWLVGQGLLIVEPGETEPRYRWPAAARRRLIADLAARSPARLVDVHERLAQWYLDAGQPALSLRHAVAAADWPLVLETTRDWWRPVLIEHPTELYAAARAVPPEVVSRNPLGTTMRAVRAVLLNVDDQTLYERAALPAEPAELDRLAARDHAGHLIDDGLAVLLAMEAARPGEPVRRYAERLLHLAAAARRHHAGAVATLYPAVQLQVGLVRLAAGDISGATTCLLAAYEDHETPVGRASAAAGLALARAWAGEPDEAELWLGRYDADPAPDNPLVASRRVAELARLLVRLDRLDLADAGAATPTSGSYRFRALELAARATLALHVGRPSDLLSEIDEARAAPAPESPFGSALIAAAEADLLLASGRGNRARAVLDGPSKAHPLLRSRRARFALLAGDSEAAVGLAGDTEWERQVGRRERLEMLLIQAVARARRGERGEAGSLVGRAFEAAGATGLWAPFTTVPRADLEELAGPLFASAPLANARAVFPPVVDVVRLTRREHEVLGRIAAGLSMHEVASALHVSYSTVRTQQRSLYRKLDARSRGEAVARARQLALLQEPTS